MLVIEIEVMVGGSSQVGFLCFLSMSDFENYYTNPYILLKSKNMEILNVFCFLFLMPQLPLKISDTCISIISKLL